MLLVMIQLEKYLLIGLVKKIKTKLHLFVNKTGSEFVQKIARTVRKMYERIRTCTNESNSYNSGTLKNVHWNSTTIYKFRISGLKTHIWNQHANIELKIYYLSDKTLNFQIILPKTYITENFRTYFVQIRCERYEFVRYEAVRTSRTQARPPTLVVTLFVTVMLF